VKVLLSGAAAAAVCGMLLGGAMQPHLDTADARPAGPQMFATWNGARSTGPFDPGAAYAGGQGRVPDYVTGTDGKTTAAWPEERAAVSPPARDTAGDDDPPPDEAAVVTRAAYDEPPAPPQGYPSLGGAAQGPQSEAEAPPASG